MQKITPFLWFDTQAEEAAKFYTSIFKDGKIVDISHYGPGAPLPEGTVMTASFDLGGQRFMALNGGPVFKFNESVSFVISCDTQEEIDHYWSHLTADGGKEVQCGWLKDKYGLSWQVVPSMMDTFMSGNPEGSKRAFAAMMGMVKMDIATLKKAYEGK